jgi:c-di-GMP-related signal transduction protein|tara:strand:+ start:241 stop:684 length:444 start_codon:yes stop_codon:yes gene_type:complete
MIDLKQIHDMWAEDSQIKMQLDESSRETPKLHAKYLELLSTTKLMLKRTEFQQKVLLKEKWLYYNGKMSQEDVVEKGWDPDPFDGLKILKGEMDYYYDSDPEIQKSEEKIQYYKTVIDTLEQIISNLNWRHQTIGNIIKWKQFESGS